MIYEKRFNPYFARGVERGPRKLTIYTAKWIHSFKW